MRRDIQFNAEDGTTLRGWLFLPDESTGPVPAVVMTHGLGAVKEMYVDQWAAALSRSGIAALLYDVRCCGISDGQPRNEYDPWKQVNDLRDAISFATTLPEVDPDRIGLFGTSFSGGHSLIVSAIDRRVKAVVSQAPTISGSSTLAKSIRPDLRPAVQRRFEEDRLARFNGEAPVTMALVSPDTDGDAALPNVETWEWYERMPEGMRATWVNACTLRTIESVDAYEPGSYIHRISPTPLLMVVALGDEITHTQEELAAYERALQPKALATFPGGHYVVYEEYRAEAIAAAVDWFTTHLLGGGAPAGLVATNGTVGAAGARA
ncbi:MAG: peptidase [Solirubrobacterales bacterium]|nr:peptidase [Solirubrobacterales bacterium]